MNVPPLPLPLEPEPLCATACPNRSATPRQLRGVVLALAAVLVVVCGFSFWQGNVLAPLFGIADVVLVAWVLNRVWRSGDAADRVRFDGTRVVVERRRASRLQRLEFHPYWVRLDQVAAERSGDAPRLWIGSHGRQVELGSFLNEARRAAFACEVRALLARAREFGKLDLQETRENR